MVAATICGLIALGGAAGVLGYVCLRQSAESARLSRRLVEAHLREMKALSELACRLPFTVLSRSGDATYPVWQQERTADERAAAVADAKGASSEPLAGMSDHEPVNLGERVPTSGE